MQGGGKLVTPLEESRRPSDQDQWAWKWSRGAATTFSELGLPTRATAYALCLYATGAAVDEANVPADPLRWKPTGATGFKYKENDGPEDGVRMVVLRAGDAGKARMQVKGKGDGLPDPSLPLALPVTVQLVNTDDGTCWQSLFDTPGVAANEGTLFKARAP